MLCCDDGRLSASRALISRASICLICPFSAGKDAATLSMQPHEMRRATKQAEIHLIFGAFVLKCWGPRLPLPLRRLSVARSDDLMVT
jgi:hypothetical protein